jgi:hypothetical protein
MNADRSRVFGGSNLQGSSGSWGSLAIDEEKLHESVREHKEQERARVRFESGKLPLPPRRK